MNDLTAKNKATSIELNKALSTWEQEMVDPLWDEGEWMEVTYHIQQRLMENNPILYKSPGARKKYLEKNKTN